MPEAVHLSNHITIGAGAPLALIAGPCVLEDEALVREIAACLKALTSRIAMPLIFKASYDKANRSSLHGYRGPGMAKGLRILEKIKQDFGLPLLSDVHHAQEVEPAAAVLDILQIPAFLCRQTDFVLAVARSGKAVNIKKGQFLAPWEMKNVVEKVTSTGNTAILITERGAMFGYNNLVVDFRGIPLMREAGWPVVFDATHSVQMPGGLGHASGGERRFAPYLARAAVAVGVDAIFMEVHPQPEKALCDGPNTLPLADLETLLPQLQRIGKAVLA